MSTPGFIKFCQSTALVGLAFGLSGCGFASLAKGYTPLEEQTVKELSGANYVPRSAIEREAILTQDLFTQAAFWSREYDLNPADLEAAINLASTLRRMGNVAKSIEVATHTRALYPRNVELMTELAASLVANNDTEKGLKIIDTALSRAPQSDRLWGLKGAVFDQLERYNEARQFYSRALSINPHNPTTLANLGLSYALAGDAKTAETWLRRAVAYPNASPSVRQNLSLVLGLQEKTDEAERWAAKDISSADAKSKLDYIRSINGQSAPQTTNPTMTMTQPSPAGSYRPPGQKVYRPYTGAPASMAGGTNVTNSAAMQAGHEKAYYGYGTPDTAQAAAQQVPPQSGQAVLNQINRQHNSKVMQAQQAAYAQRMRAQQHMQAQQAYAQQMRARQMQTQSHTSGSTYPKNMIVSPRYTSRTTGALYPQQHPPQQPNVQQEGYAPDTTASTYPVPEYRGPARTRRR